MVDRLNAAPLIKRERGFRLLEKAWRNGKLGPQPFWHSGRVWIAGPNGKPDFGMARKGYPTILTHERINWFNQAAVGRRRVIFRLQESQWQIGKLLPQPLWINDTIRLGPPDPCPRPSRVPGGGVVRTKVAGEILPLRSDIRTALAGASARLGQLKGDFKVLLKENGQGELSLADDVEAGIVLEPGDIVSPLDARYFGIVASMAGQSFSLGAYAFVDFAATMLVIGGANVMPFIANVYERTRAHYRARVKEICKLSGDEAAAARENFVRGFRILQGMTPLGDMGQVVRALRRDILGRDGPRVYPEGYVITVTDIDVDGRGMRANSPDGWEAQMAKRLFDDEWRKQVKQSVRKTETKGGWHHDKQQRRLELRQEVLDEWNEMPLRCRELLFALLCARADELVLDRQPCWWEGKIALAKGA